MTHEHEESGAENGATEAQDSLESVTTAQATLVRGGVMPCRDGRGSIPDRPFKELAPPPQRVPPTWWLDVRRTRPFD